MALQRNPPRSSKPPFSLVLPLGFLRLHLDDVQDVLDLLRSRSESVVLAAKNAVAEEAIDLRGATPEELKSVAIRVTAPDITVWLQRSKSRVETSDDSDAAQSLAAEAASLLRTRSDSLAREWFRRTFTGPHGFFFYLLVVAGIVVAGQDSTSPIAIVLFPLGGLLFAILLGSLNFSVDRTNGSTRIVPELRVSERDNAHNRALIRATVLVGVLSSAVAAVVTWLLSR